MLLGLFRTEGRLCKSYTVARIYSDFNSLDRAIIQDGVEPVFVRLEEMLHRPSRSVNLYPLILGYNNMHHLDKQLHHRDSLGTPKSEI